MSYSYWGIRGYGICIDDIEKYIDNEKVNLLVRQLNPEILFEEDVFEDNTFYGEPYSCFAEFLSELDDSNILIWENGGETQKQYLLYPPIYPWEIKDNEPESIDDILNSIINVARKVCYDNFDELVFSQNVYDISDYGCG